MKITRKTMHLGAKASTFQNALTLRKRETEAEKLLWKHLRKRQLEGVRFRRQHPINNSPGYVIDFYTHELKLGIEIDGKHHSEQDQLVYDQLRDETLGREKLITLRFTNEEVLQTTDAVLNKIRQKIIGIKFMKQQ